MWLCMLSRRGAGGWLRQSGRGMVQQGEYGILRGKRRDTRRCWFGKNQVLKEGKGSSERSNI